MVQKKFFQNNLLVHTHIEKAAGSSFLFGLKRIVGKKYVFDRRNAKKKLSELSCQELSELRVISGHFHRSKKIFINGKTIRIPFSKWELVFPKKKHYLCTLRDPISRLISFYNYVIERPGHPAFQSVDGKSLDEVVSSYIEEAHPKVKNNQCMVISGKKNPTFGNVISAVSSHYILITPHYKVNDALNALSLAMGSREVFQNVKKNVGKIKDDYISGKNMKRLSAMAAMDQKLYEYSIDHFPDFISKLHKAIKI